MSCVESDFLGAVETHSVAELAAVNLCRYGPKEVVNTAASRTGMNQHGHFPLFVSAHRER